jgi:uncharacterized protein YjbI with pentapeptide repeats
MANPKHLEILTQGVGQWNKWRVKHPEVQPDFSGAVLRWQDLSHADISGANLRRANLDYANLGEAYLMRADLSEAELYMANLFGSDLSGANLTARKRCRS